MPTSTTRTLALKRFASFTPVLFALMVFAVAPVRAPAQTTAFTYQGQLTEAGTGANGNYDMQFTLFDIAAGGVQIGPAQAVPTVPVSNGLFTVQLDFGVNAFPGANRFVEIGVRPTGGSGFQTLAPRQQISSTPYAIRTLSAATADALSSTCTGCVQDTQIQSVAGSKVSGTIPVASVPAGSGNYIQNRTTEQPSASFNIAGNGRIAGNLTVDGTLNGNGGNFIQNRTTPQAGANFNVGGNGTVAGNLSAGSLGVGTTSPAAKAHVAGSMRWGGTGAAPPYVYSDEDGSGLFLEQVGSTTANSRMRLQCSVTGGQSAYSQFFMDPANGFSFVSTGAANGNVGIGAAAPKQKLHVAGQGVFTANTATLDPGDSAGPAIRIGYDSSGDFGYINANVTGLLSKNLILQGNNQQGNVGVGTTTPQAKLDVRGDIRLGTSGELRAPGGAENLRIVRGVVNAAGSILAGSGFQAVREAAGVYKITFTPGFSAVPAVTATADRTTVSGVSYTVTTSPVTAGFTVLVVRNPEGEFESDRDFSFIAIGPR
jgi:hypothetical protein